jgi:RimJ/RimL family protein N-acetyltransferase
MTMPANKIPPPIEGKHVRLIPFTVEMISERYIGWLNDPEVNRYSRRRFVKSTETDALEFLSRLNPDEHVLAILDREGGCHVGNIQFGPVNNFEERAEIRILIGERGRWGRGFGTESIYLVTRHLFECLGLHRAEANSCNPAFIRCVEKLGWKREGCLRERFPFEGKRLDYIELGLLRREFMRDKSFECA